MWKPFLANTERKMLRGALKLATSRSFCNSYLRPLLSSHSSSTFSHFSSSSSPTSQNLAGDIVEQVPDDASSQNSDPTSTISIDRSGLCNPPGIHISLSLSRLRVDSIHYSYALCAKFWFWTNCTLFIWIVFKFQSILMDPVRILNSLNISKALSR